jgi:YYY domain-containing protein
MTFLEGAWAFLRWWAVTLIIALAVWPIVYQCLKRLPDRGFAFARMFGLIGVGYFFWLGCWLHLWPNIPGAAWLCAALLLGAGLLLANRRGEKPWQWLREHWKEALFTEGVFVALLALLTFFRAYDAGAYHTERPMDLAFLNAIMRSTYFPPNDPWLSGYAISYYHFGYILTGMVAKMASLTGSVAFSFGVTASFSMAGVGAYGILRNLLLLRARAEEKPVSTEDSSLSTVPWRKTSQPRISNYLWLPLLAPFILLFLGNMEGGLEILYAEHVGWEDGQGVFWKWLDINAINTPPIQSDKPGLMPDRASWWWWTAARIINDRDLSGKPLLNDGLIDEFPAFSFVIGDMHPHIMALPFLLAALAVVLETLLRGGGAFAESKTERWLFIGFSAFSIGSLLFLNTWDILIFGMVVIAGWVGWKLSRRELHFGKFSGWQAYIARWALTGGLALALFIPSLIGFSSQAGGIIPNVLFPTKGTQFFVFFAPLLIPIFAWLILELWTQDWKPDWKKGLLLAGAGLAILLVGSLILAFAISLNPDAIQSLGGVLGGHGPINAMVTVLARRFLDPFSTLLPIVLITVAMAVLFGWIRKNMVLPVDLPEEETPPTGGRWVNAFLLILVFWGALLILFPEYFWLRDLFGTRMNTVFKFYFQAWTFFSLAAAYGIIRLFQTVLDKAEQNNARWAYSAVGSALVFAVLLIGSVYYPLAVWSKTNGFKISGGPTLDASAYLQQSHPDDAKAIAWILANIHDNGPFVEAVGNDYDEYAGRVSTHTGIPSVVGWVFHEDQWRGGAGEQNQRRDDVAELYRTTDWNRASEILDKYGIRYVYFGPLEANTYSKRGLDKFLAHMNVIYQTDQVIIFERKVP